MRSERSYHSIPSEAGGHPSYALRAGLEASDRLLRCVGEASLASELAVDFALIVDIDPSVDRWLCRVPVGDPGLVADFQASRSRGREFLFVVAHCASMSVSSRPELPRNAKIVGSDDVDQVRLENAWAIAPYARRRVTLDDHVRRFALLEECSVTLADCFGILRHTARPVAAVADAVLAKVVEIDLDELLGSRTRLIRRQA